MVRTYRRKRSYTTSERILVHLSAEGNADPGRIAERTQEGVAARILSGRSTVTKWLGRLEGQGLVVAERGRVPGHVKRTSLYRLSPEGEAAARRLRGRLARDLVVVEALGIEPLAVPIAEAAALFAAQVDLTLAVTLVTKGCLDLSGLPASRPGTDALVWGPALRRPPRVVGRAEELRALDAWRASDAPLLAVVGIPGIGKSALVAHWVLERNPGRRVFWHEVGADTTIGSLLGDLAAFLARLGRRGLAAALRADAPIDVGVARRTLAHDLRGLPVLVVLDGAHKASDGAAEALGDLLVPLLRDGRLKVLVIARQLPPLVGRVERAGGESAAVLRLTGLEADAAVELLEARGLGATPDVLRRLAASTRGHPLLLALVAQSGARATGTIERYLEREIWTGLGPAERAVLEAASVFRRAAPVAALRERPEATDAVLTGLQGRSLLEPTVGGDLGVHDLVRDYVLARLRPARRRSLHEAAARFFLRRSDPRGELEGLHHLLEAGRADEAAKRLDHAGPRLLDTVSAEELAAAVRRVDLSAVGAGAACAFLEFLGGVLQVSGDLGPAVRQYGYAMRRAEAAGLEERLPRLLRKLAAVDRQRNRYPKALGTLVESRARLARRPDPGELREVLRELALVEQAMGDLARAADHLNASIDLATETDDPAALARGFFALGTLESQRGHPARALEHKLEGLRIAERAGNVTETARGCVTVGTALASVGRAQESLAYYDRARRLAQLLGNLRLEAYALMDGAATLLDLRRYDEAAGPIREARQLFEILGERDCLALLSINEGELEKGLGHAGRAQRAWERGLGELRTVGDRAELARCLDFVGMCTAEMGEDERARAYLEEALDIARSLGNDALLRQIEAHRPDRTRPGPGMGPSSGPSSGRRAR